MNIIELNLKIDKLRNLYRLAKTDQDRKLIVIRANLLKKTLEKIAPYDLPF